MRKIFLFSLIFVLALMLGACASNNKPVNLEKNQANLAKKESLAPVEIKGQVFTVEIPETRAERAKGLGGRESLAPDEGMLFVYDSPRRLSFWMKGMLIPLDFIWIREGKIVRLDENVQPEDYQPPETLRPEERVDQVLEVKSGTIEKFNIKVGDKVNYIKKAAD